MAPLGTCDLTQQSARRPDWRRGTGAEALRLLALATAFTALALAAGSSDDRLSRHLTELTPHDEFIYLPPTRFLRAVALGYEHALADVLWFRTINYFGRHYRSDGVYPWLASMCDAVTDLDPQAEHVYRFGGVILPWEARRIEDGLALLEKGTRNLPHSWRLRYMVGF